MTDTERGRFSSWKPLVGGAVTGLITWVFVAGILQTAWVLDLLYAGPIDESEVAIGIVGARLVLLTVGITTLVCIVASIAFGLTRGSQRTLFVASGFVLVVACEVASQGIYYLTPWLLVPAIGVLAVGALLHMVRRVPDHVAIGAPVVVLLVAFTYVWIVPIPDEVRADQRRIERDNPTFGTDAYLRQAESRYADDVEQIQGVDVADSTSSCRVLDVDLSVISCTVEVENFGATPPEVIHGRDSPEDRLQLGCRSADEIECVPAPPA